MNYIKNTKAVSDFVQLFLFVAFFTIFIYIVDFQVFTEYFKYTLCSETYLTQVDFGGKSIKLNIPVSCDFEDYVIGIKDPLSITTFNHPYQFRIVYFLYLWIISNFLNIFFIENELIFYFSTIVLGQVIVLLICTHIVSKFIKFESISNKKKKYLIATLLITSPIFKFGIFDPSQQTFVVLSSFLSLLLLMKNYVTQPYKIYSLCLMYGLLYLVNKVFFLNLCILLLLHFLYKNIDFVDYVLIYSWRFISIFFVPNIFYLLYFDTKNLIPYNDLAEYWGHFVWVKYYLFGEVKHLGTWYCHNIPDNFICYFKDTFNSVIYMFLPILLTIYIIIRNGYLNKLHLRSLKISKYSDLNFVNSFIIVFGLSFSFWSLIGWYPPVRFSLYTLGPLLTIAFIKLLSKMNFLKVELSFLYVIYFLQVPHWNNISAQRPNALFILSFLLFLYIILKNELKIKKNADKFSASL